MVRSLRPTHCQLRQANAAATIANGGQNPLTEQRVLDPETCKYVQAMMLR